MKSIHTFTIGRLLRNFLISFLFNGDICCAARHQMTLVGNRRLKANDMNALDTPEA